LRLYISAEVQEGPH